MNRFSKYYNLEWVVEVYNGRFYEQIAGFNSDVIALDYAERCYDSARRSKPGWSAYRVIHRVGRSRWEEVRVYGTPRREAD